MSQYRFPPWSNLPLTNITGVTNYKVSPPCKCRRSISIVPRAVFSDRQKFWDSRWWVLLDRDCCQRQHLWRPKRASLQQQHQQLSLILVQLSSTLVRRAFNPYRSSLATQHVWTAHRSGLSLYRTLSHHGCVSSLTVNCPRRTQGRSERS